MLLLNGFVRCTFEQALALYVGNFEEDDHENVIIENQIWLRYSTVRKTTGELSYVSPEITQDLFHEMTRREGQRKQGPLQHVLRTDAQRGGSPLLRHPWVLETPRVVDTGPDGGLFEPAAVRPIRRPRAGHRAARVRGRRICGDVLALVAARERHDEVALAVVGCGGRGGGGVILGIGLASG
jgi:hypothetical protein